MGALPAVPLTPPIAVNSLAAGLKRMTRSVIFPSRSLRLLALLLAATLVFLLFYLGSRPVSVGLFQAPWDKLVHYLFFGALAGVFWVLLGGGSVRIDGFAVLLTAVVGFFDEWHQAYNPGRTASVGDFSADVAGAITAVLIVALLRRAWRHDRVAAVSDTPHPQTS